MGIRTKLHLEQRLRGTLSNLGAFFGTPDAAAHFVSFALKYLPAEVVATLEPVVAEVLEVRRGGVLTLSLLGTLWVAGSGVEAFRAALNLAHGVSRPRPFWVRRLHDIGLVVASALAIVVVMTAVVFGPLLWRALTWLFTVPESWHWIWNTARYFAGVVVLVATVLIFYRFLPNARLSLVMVVPGALLASALWLMVATGFSVYLDHLGAYSVTYGSLGGVITTLLFFYISAAVFILGAEFNAVLIAQARERPAQMPPSPDQD